VEALESRFLLTGTGATNQDPSLGSSPTPVLLVVAPPASTAPTPPSDPG